MPLALRCPASAKVRINFGAPACIGDASNERGPRPDELGF
jgi:hypothetical protein